MNTIHKERKEEMSDSTTDRLITDWDNATERLERLRQEVNSAECALRNATNALAKWLTPDDSEDAERFSIWQNGRLLSVVYNASTGDSTVWVRQLKKVKD